jgi:hypothetical protein
MTWPKTRPWARIRDGIKREAVDLKTQKPVGIEAGNDTGFFISRFFYGKLHEWRKIKR